MGTPKSLRNIEEKMSSLEEGSLRYHVLESAKNFKSSWIELGRSLYSVFKDKLYKEWGYGSFDAYSAKEIGIKKITAMKLLRSYYFLEKEEPAYLKKDYVQGVKASNLPSYEAIDLLRRAKTKKSIDENEYTELKNDILEEGRDVGEVKKALTSLIRSREEVDPQEAFDKKRQAAIRRFLGNLKGLKKEVELGKILPLELLKDIQDLIQKIEREIK